MSVVVPTLNEAENLPHVLTRIPCHYEVILVDGNSTDGTVEVAHGLRPDARVVKQSRRGKGEALACGFAVAEGDIIVMLDADGSAQPEEITRFVDALVEGADFAKGSRFVDGGGSSDITRLRRSGNAALSWLVNLLFGTRYTDLCYGYNAFWRRCLPALMVDCDGFEVETLINIRVARAGLRITEVPSFEDSRIHGTSNLRTFRDGWRVLRTIVRERLRPAPDLCGLTDSSFTAPTSADSLVGSLMGAVAEEVLESQMNPASTEKGRLDPEAVDSALRGKPEFESSSAAVQPGLPVGAGAAGGSSARSSRLSVSVVIPAYTIDRWSLTVKAVESVRAQTVIPEEIVVCIDNNDELLERARAEWSCAAAPPVRVMANRLSKCLNGSEAHTPAHGKTRRGGGSTRNCAVETVTSDIVAFLDDDAWAEPDWLERLLCVHEGFPVVAVGGPPLPDYETQRPAWFPASFDWTFGCAYEGLPNATGPLRHLFGGNMAVRRDSLMALNGFKSTDSDSSSKPAAARAPLDDLDLCMRLAHRFGADSLYYEPRAVVHHYVPAERLSWRYFYRRCYFVNRQKAQTLRDIGPAGNLAAELAFVWRTITRSCVKDLRRGISGESGAFGSLGATLAGITLAGLGHLRGRIARPIRGDSSSNSLAPDLPGSRNQDRSVLLETGDT